MLLADDHPTNRIVIELILEVVGAEVVSVADGLQALEQFKAQTFDVVLMDVQMPVMDGLTAIRAIRAFEVERGGRRTPVHVVTTNALPEHFRQSIAAGADGHITKPVAAPELLTAVMTAAEEVAEADQAAASATH
ncbi:MAG TPA: response regulator [Caulobacteraceae bacterium]|nr:response regulator [Caulobacteraceae bacterium]